MSKLGVVEDTLFVPMLGRIYASEYCPQILYDPKALELKKRLPSGLPEQNGQSQYMGCWPLRSCDGWPHRITEGSYLRRDDKYRFSLGWGRDTAEKIAVGDFLEKLKNRKSDLIVQAVWEYIGNHPEVMAENAKIVITVRSTPTDEQTFAKIQSMIDAALESLKDNMKYQIEQENRSGQEEPTGPNQQDLDDMLDNLTIFDQ